MAFQEIEVRNLKENLFTQLGSDWMLITAGNADKCNTMTAGWGQIGTLWARPVATVYIRPQRYTRDFVEREEYFSLGFFDMKKYQDALTLLGTTSGRDTDKIAQAGLHAGMYNDVPIIEEAHLILLCRKIYKQDIVQGGFLDANIEQKFYREKDYSRMYVGEIKTVLKQDK